MICYKCFYWFVTSIQFDCDFNFESWTIKIMWKSSFRNLDWDISDKFMTYPTLPNAESASSVFCVRARLYINCFHILGIMYQPFGIHWTHMREWLIIIYPFKSKLISPGLTWEHLHTNKVTMSNKNQEIQREEKAPRECREIK